MMDAEPSSCDDREAKRMCKEPAAHAQEHICGHVKLSADDVPVQSAVEDAPLAIPASLAPHDINGRYRFGDDVSLMKLYSHGVPVLKDEDTYSSSQPVRLSGASEEEGKDDYADASHEEEDESVDERKLARLERRRRRCDGCMFQDEYGCMGHPSQEYHMSYGGCISIEACEKDSDISSDDDNDDDNGGDDHDTSDDYAGASHEEEDESVEERKLARLERRRRRCEGCMFQDEYGCMGHPSQEYHMSHGGCITDCEKDPDISSDEDNDDDNGGDDHDTGDDYAGASH